MKTNPLFIIKYVLPFLVIVCLATNSFAQKWTLWYGVNYFQESMYDRWVSSWRYANAGVDYSFSVSNWDFTAGVGLNTKGGLGRVNFVQVETNASYRLINTSNHFSMAVFGGPFLGVKIASDINNWAPLPNYNPLSTGIQTGIMFKKNWISLKLGYEKPFITIIHGDKLSPAPDKPYSLFTRIGFSF